MIDSIFRTYPAVQKKYEALVPRKMTATSFWEKFIHSYYFQREREKDDIFNECAKTEDMGKLLRLFIFFLFHSFLCATSRSITENLILY